jgi:hypothetical protein
MSSIFLSHSHADKSLARKLAADLRVAGHVVWIDEAEIEIGDSLVEKIREGIDQVDYVAALLSSTSVESEWVKRELDLASNREIDERRVVVLPLMVEEVVLPGFLKGKFYGDFTSEEKYDPSLELLLRKLGPANPLPKVSKAEFEQLQQQLSSALGQVEAHRAEVQAHRAIALKGKSEKLQAAVNEVNQKFPSHAPINATYAFEVSDISVTLDYVLWAIAKSEHRGGHPLEILLSIDNKWGQVEAMLQAYGEMLEQARS